MRCISAAQRRQRLRRLASGATAAQDRRDSAAVRRSAVRAAPRRAGRRAPPAPRSSSSPCRRRSGIRAGTPCRRRTASSPRPPRRTPSHRRRAGRSAPAAACWRGRASGAVSSRVTRKLGHITPASKARQVPLLLHISTAPSMPPSGPGCSDQSSFGVKSAIARIAGRVAEQRAVIHARRAHDAAGVQHAGRDRTRPSPSRTRARCARRTSPRGTRCAPGRRRARRCASPCIRAPGRKHSSATARMVRDVGRVLHVQHRPDMQAADRGVRVPGALGAVPLEHVVQPLGVVGEVVQIDRAVLDERHRFAVALHRHHDVEAGLAHRGDVGLERRRRSRAPPRRDGRDRPSASSSSSQLRRSGASSWPWNSTISSEFGFADQHLGRSSRDRSGCRGRDRSSCDRPVPPPRDRAATMCCAASIALRKVGNWQMPSTLRGLIGCSVSSIAAENASVPSDPTSSRARLSRPAARDAGVSTSML